MRAGTGKAAAVPGADTADSITTIMNNPTNGFEITHDDLTKILAENKTPTKQKQQQPRSNVVQHGNNDMGAASTAVETQYDITHDDLAQILAENKTPVGRKHRGGKSNPLVSPATSEEICAFVQAATGGLGLVGMDLTMEENGGGTCDRVEVADEVLFGALDVALRHHSSFNPILSLGDIGRLASCSKSISNLVGEAPWRQMFDRAAQSGRPYGALTDHAASLARNYKASTVCGEDGLLSCFASPTTSVIGAVGWKKAAACLLSKTCSKCGVLCALANPITWARMCRTCALSDPSSYLINKTNARLFLLSDKDLGSLRSASYQSKSACKKECTSTLYLLSEVMAASYKKYVDADGLAAEIGRRRAAALERYERSQSTSKPQKKRPRIERTSDRPGDNVRRIMFADGGLPVGTCVDLKCCTMHPSVSCRHCTAMGSVEDISLHEKLVHSKFGTTSSS